MRTKRIQKARRSVGTRGVGAMSFLLAMATLAACAGTPPLPQTRSVITLTGERVQADPEAMVEVDRWLRPQLAEIERNPDLVRVLQEDRPLYPWQTFEILDGTAQLTVQRGQGDAETPFRLYAHFRLMAETGELARWLPEAVPETEDGRAGPAAEGLELERLILRRISDVWLLGRSVFDTTPYGPLDELLYSNEAGFLDEFILTTQRERFEEEATAHFEANPDRAEAFRAWFMRVFERPGPGFMDGAADEPGAEPADEPGAGPAADPMAAVPDVRLG
ncbi:MAG: hypothetical protein EA350_06930 [Gemmatimonadales bacterium]|nr:MAG: hypothetical protein EA350_06930 [Gemmatimonadales bacterium]